MYYTFEDLLRARNEAESQQQSVNPAETPHVWIPPEADSQPIMAEQPYVNAFTIEYQYTLDPSPMNYGEAAIQINLNPKTVIQNQTDYTAVENWYASKGTTIQGADLPTGSPWWHPDPVTSKGIIIQRAYNTPYFPIYTPETLVTGLGEVWDIRLNAGCNVYNSDHDPIITGNISIADSGGSITTTQSISDHDDNYSAIVTLDLSTIASFGSHTSFETQGAISPIIGNCIQSGVLPEDYSSSTYFTSQEYTSDEHDPACEGNPIALPVTLIYKRFPNSLIYRT